MEGKISAITRQKGDKARASVFIDGEFAFGIEQLTIEEFRLRKGDEIDRELYGRLIDFDYKISAKRIAQRFLNHRARSEKEVRQRLEREEIPEEIIIEVIDTLKGYNLIDDTAWARAYVNDRLLRKQLSARELERELRQKGIAKPIIDETIGALSASESDDDRARKAAEKCLPKYRRATGEEHHRKVYGYLARRGFSHDVIERTYRAVMLSDTAGSEEGSQS